MSDIQSTPFSNKANILAELWLNYRQDSEFQDFIEYNDIGLPIAYAISVDAVTPTSIGEAFVNETFDLLLAALEINDNGFEFLDDLFAEDEHNNPD